MRGSFTVGRLRRVHSRCRRCTRTPRRRPRTMRSNRPGSAAHTSGSNTRQVPFIHAVSGMMLNALPACTWVTLTTTSLNGSVPRLAMDWSAVTMCERHSTGSMPKCGMAACAPLPRTVTLNSSTAAINGPGVMPTVPSGRSCQTCRPNAASGRGFASTPSRDHALGAAADLLGGLEAQLHLARQCCRLRDELRDSRPAGSRCGSRARTRASCPGCASGTACRSPRGSAVRPCRHAAARCGLGLPPFTSAVTPVFPTPVRTSSPSARSFSATSAAVRTSSKASSGCMCRSRRTATSSSTRAPVK